MENHLIVEDLRTLGELGPTERMVVLFHDPPFHTSLDVANHSQYNPEENGERHIGSRAIKQFISVKQPWLTLHGHVHESTRLSGSWKEKMGSTVSYNAAHDGPELSVISFMLENPDEAERNLV